MKIVIKDNYEASCKEAAQIIIEQIKKKPTSKIGLATGGTAEGVYAKLIEAYKAGEVSFSKVKTVNLDEYIGIEPTHSQSYQNYMHNKFFNHVDINKNNTYVASGKNNIEDEIRTFNDKLEEDGFIDVQLLGIGVDGHIGFNEPGENLTAGVHVEELTGSTIEANSRFFESVDQVPRTAITMGVGDIMKAEKIVLVANGLQKNPAVRALITDDLINCEMPATVLKMHRDVTVVIDKELANAVGVEH